MLREIVDIAGDAGKMLLASSPEKVTAKDGVGNFVTDCDVRVQEYVLSRLRAAAPGAAFLGEEGARATVPAGGDCFIVDPIDGTQNFITGTGHSCVSIGMVRDGRPVLGAVCDPYKGEMFCAEAGCGAFLNGRRIAVSQKPLGESVVMVEASPYDRSFADASFALMRRVFDASLDVRSTGSAALDLCYVAAGRCGGFAEYVLAPWDYCAGALIIEEAGGMAARIDGTPLDYFRGGSVLAAGPAAYAELLRVSLGG